MPITVEDILKAITIEDGVAPNRTKFLKRAVAATDLLLKMQKLTAERCAEIADSEKSAEIRKEFGL